MAAQREKMFDTTSVIWKGATELIHISERLLIGVNINVYPTKQEKTS